MPKQHPAARNKRPPSVAGPAVSSAFACLRDHRFVAFAAFFSVNLLAYNQLYFALPLELDQGGAGAGTLAVLFILASVLTIALQLPLSAVAARLGPAAALRAGFASIALGFAAMALLGSTGLHLVPGLPLMTGPIVLVILLGVGRMLAGPAGMRQVHGFAAARPLSAYYGLLASCGGLTVLLGNTLTGVLRDTLESAFGWMFLVFLAAVAAAFLPRFLPVSHQKDQP
jgi:MFS family permease